MVQYPPNKGISVVGTTDDSVHFSPGFILAFPLSLAYPVMKGLMHVPLDQIQLLIREEVLRFANIYGGNRETLPSRLRNHAVDTHEVRGIGLFQARIHIVEFSWQPLWLHRLSLSIRIDTLSSRSDNLDQGHIGQRGQRTSGTFLLNTAHGYE